jgi:hypothetical protein
MQLYRLRPRLCIIKPPGHVFPCFISSFDCIYGSTSSSSLFIHALSCTSHLTSSTEFSYEFPHRTPETIRDMATDKSSTLVRRSTKRSSDENRFTEWKNAVRRLPAPDCAPDQYQLMDFAIIIISRFTMSLSSRTRTVGSRPLGLTHSKTLIPGSPKIYANNSRIFYATAQVSPPNYIPTAQPNAIGRQSMIQTNKGPLWMPYLTTVILSR